MEKRGRSIREKQRRSLIVLGFVGLCYSVQFLALLDYSGAFKH